MNTDIKNKFKDLKQDIIELETELADNMTDSISSRFSKIKEGIGNLYDNMQDRAEDFQEKGKNTLSNVGNRIEKSVDNLKEKVKEVTPA